MQVIASEDLTWIDYPGQRISTIKYQAMFQGTPNSPDNFELSIVRMGEGGVFSPRHRHNFDQFRYPFNGAYSQSPKQDIPQHQIGFIAEGAFYGPLELPQGLEFLILQFGGASGHGYMSQNELMHGTNELKKVGEFTRGVFHRAKVDGKAPEGRLNQDAYEAVWEFVNGKRIEYPVPRYREPVTVNPDAFQWMPVDGSSGVATRTLGVFNERGTSATEFRFTSGAGHVFTPGPSRRLMVVLQGAVEHGGKTYTERSGFDLLPGETLQMEGAGPQDAVLLIMQLPRFQ